MSRTTQDGQNKDKNWSTNDEFIYIDSIGRVHEQTRKCECKELLSAYLNALDKRVNWGKLSAKKIRAYALLRYSEAL